MSARFVDHRWADPAAGEANVKLGGGPRKKFEVFADGEHRLSFVAKLTYFNTIIGHGIKFKVHSSEIPD